MKLIDIFKMADFNRVEAMTLAYLFKREKGYLLDIEEHTKLRQPEASRGLRKLAEYGWVSIKTEKQGIGRPRIFYKFDRKKAVDNIKEMFREKLKKYEEAYKQLENKL